MKLLCLFFSITFFLIQIVFGEIKNGYASEIENARAVVKNLRQLLETNDSLTTSERKHAKINIRYYEDYVAYYELTSYILDRFRLIAPDLYSEIDSIRDKKGRSTDIYIKLIPMAETTIKHPGVTCLAHMDDDADAYLSEYGKYTVSVKIWVMDNALTILAHEFGHVKYQVGNLSSYLAYYKQNYKTDSPHNYLGHNPSDPSGKSAAIFERMFSKKYQDYLSITNKKKESPFALLQAIRTRINDQED